MEDPKGHVSVPFFVSLFGPCPFALQLILVFPELSSAKTMVIAVRAPSPVRIALNRANHSFPSDANSMQILLGPAKLPNIGPLFATH
jgi:hypothetical protein